MLNDLIFRTTGRAGKDLVHHFVQLLDVADEETEAHRGGGASSGPNSQEMAA